MHQTKHYPNVLRFLILLTVLFIATEIACVALYQQFNELSPVTRYALSLPSLLSNTSLQPLGIYLLAQFGLYAAYIFILWHMTVSIGQLLKLSELSVKFVAFSLYANSTLSLILLNAFFIPHSFFTKLTFPQSIDKLWMAILIISVTINIVALLISFALMVFDIVRFKNLKYQSVLFILTAFVVASILHLYTHEPYKQQGVATDEHPNIFVIGFDALRPDYLSFFKAENSPTPNFDDFLKHAVIFSQNYTPLAHTAPAWATVLTGQYPLHHKIREDQTLIDLIKIDNPLPKQLQQVGYNTIFAADERNYNNIDQHFGFNKIIGPSGTASDSVVTTLNDFPLSNLVSITPLGKYLFPYSYINRTAANIYNPQNFLKEVEGALVTAPNKPLFLAIHFNLSAAPYYWFNDQMPAQTDQLSLYKNAIRGDDILLKRLMTLLQENHYLDHALVFLMSDHGITYGLTGDRAIAAANYVGEKDVTKLNDIDKSIGYGNDLLSLKQNSNLLAFQSFGSTIKPHIVSSRTSLTDITPTIMAFLNLPESKNIDGVSLKAAITAEEAVPDRAMYFETGMQQTEKNLILQSAYYYMTAHGGVVAIYPPLLKLLATNKQRGVLQRDWFLVYFPQNKNNIIDTKLGFVLLNVKTGQWTTEINAFSKAAPFAELKQKLEDFYGSEMSAYKNFQS